MNNTSTSVPQIPPHADGARPPMPKVLYNLINPMMKLMLRSPLHGRMSDRLMLLSFTGRKSGKRYTIPVGYVRMGEELAVFTRSPWWKNLRGGAPVHVRIQGKDYQGTGEVVSDYPSIKRMVRAMIDRNGEEMSRRMGFYTEKTDPTVEELAEATKGVVFLRIRLK